MIELPDAVRRKAAAAGAGAWIDALPDTVADLGERWGFELGRPLEGGTEAYVAEVRLATGDPAVFKLLMPREGLAVDHEITVLDLAGGEGCARLLRSDRSQGALLIERLGPTMFALGVPIDRRHELLARLAQRIWRPAPGCGLRSGAEKGRWLIERITARWEQLGRPCSARAVEHAIACAERRIDAHDDERAVLVHGDVHQWNALAAGDGWKLIDPDGLLAEPAYDLGIIMREDPAGLLGGDPRARARRLAALTGVDAEAIWEWGVVERVSTGLLCTEIGLQPVGRAMLRAADHVAARGGGRNDPVRTDP